MAQRSFPIARWPGFVLAALLAGLILSSLGAVAMSARAGHGLGPADWAAIRFTISQALVSAALSVVLAVPLARALARRRFPGRAVLITLLGAPFILPVIVAVFGLLSVFGRSGWLSQALGILGLPPVSIYGFEGVVLAHVFFNLPLATRLVLQGWQAIPAEHFRLAAQLGCRQRDLAWLLERPMLWRILPGAFALIFALCLTSFAVALTLGGGPRATTVELAIYQAVHFDFDLGRAAWLAALQVLLAGLGALIAFRFAGHLGFGGGLDRPVERWDANARALQAQDAGLIALAALFLLLPILAVVLAGAQALPSLPEPVWRAAALTLAVALASTALLFAIALPLAASIAARQKAGLLEAIGFLSLAASPLVIGTGLFLMLFPFVNPQALALPITALVNALMALPFALRIMVPALREIMGDYGRLVIVLNMRGFSLWTLVILPRLRAPMGFAAGLTAALSAGDLGVIALFADPDLATLPLQIYRLMGAYQMQDAAAAALLLLLLSMGLFATFDGWGRANARG